eukprot:scaffold167800_cov43-Attheya_sp.AAC.1
MNSLTNEFTNEPTNETEPTNRTDNEFTTESTNESSTTEFTTYAMRQRVRDQKEEEAKKFKSVMHKKKCINNQPSDFVNSTRVKT